MPVDGGFRVSGRKVFASQVPVGDVFSTMFVLDGDTDERVILNMAVPVKADGVTVLDNWDTLGMRGTGSQDVVIEDVFVPEEKVLARRPYGVVDGPLQVIISNAFPVIGAVYLGIAEAARDAAVALVVGTARAEDVVDPAPGRADGQPAAGDDVGPRGRDGRRSATTPSRRWRTSSR